MKTISNKLNTNLMIIFGFLFIIILVNSEKLYQFNQLVSQLTIVTKFFNYPNEFPISPQLSFRLIGSNIIYDTGFGCKRIDQGRSYVDEDINISFCFFSRSVMYSGFGGVIYFSYGSSYSMNVKYSMFFNGVCSQHGGAIHFYSHKSCLRMICANSCSASFAYHLAYLSASQVNHVEYLSVSNCSHDTTGDFSLFLFNGDQRVDNSNSSMNNACSNSGIRVFESSSFKSSHNTFSNNKVSSYICICFYSTSGTISMSYDNIAYNNSPPNGVVTVYGEGSIQMMY